MAFMNWSDKLTLGIAQFDQQHQKLVNMVNHLHMAMSQGQGQQELARVLSGLVSYTKIHFADEEKAMQANGYTGLLAHRGEHKKLTDQVMRLVEDYEAGRGGLSVKTLNFLRDWLVNHIQGTDARYAPFLREKGMQ